MSIPPAVAAGHPSTAEAGAAVLADGGTAADAAVAMMLVGCAAETLFTGLAGGGFATHYEAASGLTTCVDFFVHVPGLGGRRRGPGVPIEVRFVGQQVPYDIGASTVAVPGLPAGARHLWQRWGRLPWSRIVEPGLRASYGTPFPAAHADLLPQVDQAMCVGEGRSVYLRADGRCLQEGDRLWHRDQHHAYELLAEDPDAFYRGAYADALVAAVEDGGALDATDLRAYAVSESEPRTTQVGAARVAARGDDLDDLLGTLHRAQGVGDPTTDPASALALVKALLAPDRRAETTNLVAADAAGNVCGVTTTLGLGSGVWVPGFGVHLNSMLGEGELVRTELLPGVRMGSMMSPLIAFDGDRPRIVAGAAGGSRIRPALVQTVLRMLGGAHPQEAIDAPRLNAQPVPDAHGEVTPRAEATGRRDTAATGLPAPLAPVTSVAADERRRAVVRCEPGFAAAVLDALDRAGHQVLVAEDRAPYFGGVSALSDLGGGADPRRGGAVITL